MRLTKLSMRDFAPFEDGEIEFPVMDGTGNMAEVQMFTGENGTGKTRVLATLMASLGNIQALQDRVRQEAETWLEVSAHSPASFPRTLLSSDFHGLWRYRKGGEDPENPHFPIQRDDVDVFAMAGSGSALVEDAAVSPATPVKPARTHEALNLSGPVGGPGIMQRLTNLRMQVALERDTDGRATTGRSTHCLQNLEAAISTITGRKFSLVMQLGREIRLMVEWGKDKLFFAELPDGLRSLLNWLAGWVVLQAENFEDSDRPLSKPVTLILDEPENHLHPAWQRRVLPAVQRLFPQAQIFVVTHSPFVVSSLNEGWIHKFTRGEDGLVRIEPPQKASRGDSYMTAVQEILDLSEWFDPETEKEIADFEVLLDRAYEANGSNVEAMRKKAAELSQRSQEVTNLIMGQVLQFDRNMAERRPAAVQENKAAGHGIQETAEM